MSPDAVRNAPALLRRTVGRTIGRTIGRTVGRAVAVATIAAVALAGSARPLTAQGGIRTVEIGRQLAAESAARQQPLQVLVSYDMGSVVVHGADEPRLYQLRLAYDPERSSPVYSFDSAGRYLHVGLQRGDRSGREGQSRPELRLDLARSVPLDLRLEMGAAVADLDLGGMQIRRLGVESGASDAVLHFDAPNRTEMQLLSLDVGAASLRARGLGNARAREVRVNVGVGSADLDFGGEWTGDMNLELQVALGSARMRVPEEVGVRIQVRRFLASFEREGFVKRDDFWYSPNWDTAPHKLHVRARTALGELEIVRGR